MQQTPKYEIQSASGIVLLREFTCPQCSGKGWFRNALVGCKICLGKGVIDGIALQDFILKTNPVPGVKKCKICQTIGHYAKTCYYR